MSVSWTARALLFFILLAFIFAIISLLAPYWYHEEPHTHVGLFASCKSYPQMDCTWSHADLLEWEKRQPGWWILCQVLFTVSVFTQFFCLVATFMINCSEYVGVFLKCFNGIFICFAFLEQLATVSHFGRWAYKERGVEMDTDAYRNFGWAFLLACLSVFCMFLSIICFILYAMSERRRQRKEADRYAQSVNMGYPLQQQMFYS